MFELTKFGLFLLFSQYSKLTNQNPLEQEYSNVTGFPEISLGKFPVWFSVPFLLNMQRMFASRWSLFSRLKPKFIAMTGHKVIASQLPEFFTSKNPALIKISSFSVEMSLCNRRTLFKWLCTSLSQAEILTHAVQFGYRAEVPQGLSL